MDKISELLQYVHRTNPDMTREKLIEELSKSDYAARSLIFTKENIVALGKNKSGGLNRRRNCVRLSECKNLSLFL